MAKDYTYKKETANGTEWYHGVIHTREKTILSPPEEKIIEDGWQKHNIESPVLYLGEDNNIQDVVLNQIQSSHPKLKDLICPVTDGIIYHYTTWEVLFNGVLNVNNHDSNGNSCLILRAYSVNYMNDRSEGLLLPLGVANREREVIQERYGRDTIQNPLLQHRYDIWQRGAEQHKQKRFSISFSHENDSLPMWNYYGFNGKGICLGFDVKAIWNQGYETYMNGFRQSE